MAKPAKAVSERDVNYTVPAILALVGIVLVTALYFAQPNVAIGAAGRSSSANLAGAAYGGSVDVDAPESCTAYSYCDGSRLVRQDENCHQYQGFCKYGCLERPDGAICR